MRNAVRTIAVVAALLFLNPVWAAVGLHLVRIAAEHRTDGSDRSEPDTRSLPVQTGAARATGLSTDGAIERRIARVALAEVGELMPALGANRRWSWYEHSGNGRDAGRSDWHLTAWDHIRPEELGAVVRLRVIELDEAQAVALAEWKVVQPIESRGEARFELARVGSGWRVTRATTVEPAPRLPAFVAGALRQRP